MSEAKCPGCNDLSIKLQRTVSAAYHALLEMSAWMGIPENKRHEKIKYLMENVSHCAEHDMRHVDESQRNAALVREIKRLGAEVEELMKVDYWQDRHDIVKKDLITAIGFLREAKAKFTPSTTNSLVDDFLKKHEVMK